MFLLRLWKQYSSEPASVIEDSKLFWFIKMSYVQLADLQYNITKQKFYVKIRHFKMVPKEH